MIWYWFVLAYLLGMWLFSKLFMIIFERSDDRLRMKFRLTGRKVNVREPYSSTSYYTGKFDNPFYTVYCEEDYPYVRSLIWPVMIAIYLAEFLVFEPLKNLLTKRTKT